MKPKDIINCYMTFFEEYLKRFDCRRTYEWKFNFSLWTAIILFTGFILKDLVKPELLPSYNWILFAHIAIFAIYVFLWSGFLHRANTYDKDYAFNYKRAIEKIIADENLTESLVVEEPKKRYFGPLLNWSPLAQFMVTALLLLLSWYVYRSALTK